MVVCKEYYLVALAQQRPNKEAEQVPVMKSAMSTAMSKLVQLRGPHMKACSSTGCLYRQHVTHALVRSVCAHLWLSVAFV